MDGACLCACRWFDSSLRLRLFASGRLAGLSARTGDERCMHPTRGSSHEPAGCVDSASSVWASRASGSEVDERLAIATAHMLSAAGACILQSALSIDL